MPHTHIVLLVPTCRLTVGFHTDTDLIDTPFVLLSLFLPLL